MILDDEGMIDDSLSSLSSLSSDDNKMTDADVDSSSYKCSYCTVTAQSRSDLSKHKKVKNTKQFSLTIFKIKTDQTKNN